MKLKGLAKTLKMLESLDSNINDKIDNIQWSGNRDAQDQQKDEMLNEAAGMVLDAKEALEQISELQLEDF